MEPLTPYEKEILQDIHNLSPAIQEKVARFVHLLTREFVTPSSDIKKAEDEFLSACGAWDDIRTVAEQLDDIYGSRCSTSRTEIF